MSLPALLGPEPTTGDEPPALSARGLTVGYAGRRVLEALDVDVPAGSFTAVVGPNACGKSTLLKALAGQLPPTAGEVAVSGRPLAQLRRKALARRLGFLPQTPTAPPGITVAELVSRGRYPHRPAWTATVAARATATEADRAAVADALARTGTADLADRDVAELSGGQRQRVWLALVLAQQAPLLLLDEPTTYLDLPHQLDVLDLCAHLRSGGHTVVAVLHDLNLAARYATHLIAMRDGRIVAEGAPGDIVTADVVTRAFGLDCRVVPDPETGTPLVVPRARP
ncbi:MAG: ABC transporter ATP-binding protein [Kineosporiaceae bacterium]